MRARVHASVFPAKIHLADNIAIREEGGSVGGSHHEEVQVLREELLMDRWYSRRDARSRGRLLHEGKGVPGAAAEGVVGVGRGRL